MRENNQEIAKELGLLSYSEAIERNLKNNDTLYFWNIGQLYRAENAFVAVRLKDGFRKTDFAHDCYDAVPNKKEVNND